MIKKKLVVMLMLAITPLCAESIEEMKDRLLNEMESCYYEGNRGIVCQLKMRNKIMLLDLIHRMKKENKE